MNASECGVHRAGKFQSRNAISLRRLLSSSSIAPASSVIVALECIVGLRGARDVGVGTLGGPILLGKPRSSVSTFMLRDESPVGSVQFRFVCLDFDEADRFVTKDFFRLLKEELARGSKGMVKVDCCSFPSFESLVLRRRPKMPFEALFCAAPSGPSAVRSDVRPDAWSGSGDDGRCLPPLASFEPDNFTISESFSAVTSRGTASSNI